uniref:LRAT domain-containing protein n=1 Tax=Oncorhynchus kisutch TaxID=8019 RepID=A0A8C7FMT4_ONCKI
MVPLLQLLSRQGSKTLSMTRPCTSVATFLEVPRTLFTHFGIYLGNNREAHFIPDILPVFTKNKGAISKTVTNNWLILGMIGNSASARVTRRRILPVQPREGDEVEKLMGSMTYSLLWYNCEHYIIYCRYSMAISYQTYQFCLTVKKIICSRMNAYLTALCGTGTVLYLGLPNAAKHSTTLLIPFTIRMAS